MALDLTELSDLPKSILRHAKEVDESCPIHNTPLKRYPAGYKGETQLRCDLCDDEQEEKDHAAKLRELRHHRLRCIAKIPPKYSRITLKDIIGRKCNKEQKEALEKLEKWGRLVNQKEWPHLIVIGDKGTGKTEMLSALIASLVRIDITCRYTTCCDLLAEIKSTYKSKTVTESSVKDEYMKPHVLIIDEISGPNRDVNETMSDRDQYLIESLVDERYRSEKKTVFAGNIRSMADFIALVGERVASRVQENGVAIVCNWPPYRKWADKASFEAAAEASGVILC